MKKLRVDHSLYDKLVINAEAKGMTVTDYVSSLLQSVRSSGK
jgi:predicted HicB family RNase H-like nuclease